MDHKYAKKIHKSNLITNKKNIYKFKCAKSFILKS